MAGFGIFGMLLFLHWTQNCQISSGGYISSVTSVSSHPVTHHRLSSDLLLRNIISVVKLKACNDLTNGPFA